MPCHVHLGIGVTQIVSGTDYFKPRLKLDLSDWELD